MKKQKSILAAFICLTAISGCMKMEDTDDGNLVICPPANPVLFIANEGNFSYGNASLTLYDTVSGETEDDVFYRANGQKLGDVAQSMTLHDGTLWIVVNNSNVIFAVNPATLKELGRIDEGLVSPRYIHFVSEDKAYVTQMYDNRIAIVDPGTYSVTGYIETGLDNTDGCSTEQMVQSGTDVLVNCWSYQKEVLRIDTESDSVTGRLETGIQPAAIQLDCNGKLWVLNDGGGWAQNPVGYENPTLKIVDPEKMSVEKTFTFPEGSSVGALVMNSARDSLFFLNNGVYAMSINDSRLPEDPFLTVDGAQYLYGLTVAPSNSDIYVSDALDFMQDGTVYRYSGKGELLDEFKAGISPKAFCWY